MTNDNHTPRIERSVRAELRACLEAEDNDGVYADIAQSRALIYHPFAQPYDVLLLRVRIAEGKKVLAKRLRNALELL